MSWYSFDSPAVPAEAFSNPFAPPEQDQIDSRKLVSIAVKLATFCLLHGLSAILCHFRANLSNDDFRRLLMTPKLPAVSNVAPAPSTAAPKERWFWLHYSSSVMLMCCPNV